MDAAYIAKVGNSHLLSSQGSFGVAEEILCTYIDLDRLIDACHFDRPQRTLLNAVMEGYSLHDMDELYGWKDGCAENAVRAMTKRIVRQNDRQWKAFHNARKNGK